MIHRLPASLALALIAATADAVALEDTPCCYDDDCGAGSGNDVGVGVAFNVDVHKPAAAGPAAAPSAVT